MTVAKAAIRTAACSLAILASACVFATQGEGRSQVIYTAPNKARNMLFKSMQRTFSVNVVAVTDQRDPGADSDYQRVKVERAADGRTRYTTLAPIRLMGYQSIDDGVRCKIFLPDQSMVIDQESPLKQPDDIEKRIKLANENYTFKMDGMSLIAGRPAWCVVAMPRDGDMEVRRFYIDQETNYPLRLEGVSANGARRTFLDTKVIQFPKMLDDEVFQFKSLTNVRVIKYERPKNVKISSAASQLGFKPAVPTDLPLGFVVQDAQINDAPEWHALAMRLTDGLVRVTVYQWRIGDRPIRVKAFDDSSMMDHDGIRFMVVSDMGANLRSKLLQSFVDFSTETLSEWLAVSLVPPLGDFGELRDSVCMFRRLEDTPSLGRDDHNFDRLDVQTRRSTPKLVFPVKTFRDPLNAVQEETKQ